MKKIVITGFIVTLCMLLIPLSAGKGKKTNETRAVAAVKTDVKEETVSEETGEETGGTVTFRIKTKDKIITLSAYNYIIGGEGKSASESIIYTKEVGLLYNVYIF